MMRLIRRRLLNAVPVLLLVAVGNFLLLAVAPGDAVDAYLSETGGGAGGEAAALRATWGLGGGLLPRLLAYLWGLLRLDLGRSVAFGGRPVLGVVLERLPTTLLLMGSATALAFGLGVGLGLLAGARPGDWRDRLLTSLSLLLYATPTFWLGLMLVVLVSVRLGWLPSAGLESIPPRAGLARALDLARHLALPVLTLGLVYTGLYLRLMRAGMVEAWGEDFVRTAAAKGLPRRRLVLRHVARNALLPVVTVLGLQAGTLLGGSVVVESVFAIPGLGRLAAEAVTQRDVPLLLGVVLSGTVLVILANLLVDLAYARLDPRVGTGA